jgi:hypothetical protein
LSRCHGATLLRHSATGKPSIGSRVSPGSGAGRTLVRQEASPTQSPTPFVPLWERRKSRRRPRPRFGLPVRSQLQGATSVAPTSWPGVNQHSADT